MPPTTQILVSNSFHNSYFFPIKVKNWLFASQLISVVKIFACRPSLFANCDGNLFVISNGKKAFLLFSLQIFNCSQYFLNFTNFSKIYYHFWVFIEYVFFATKINIDTKWPALFCGQVPSPEHAESGI